LSGLVEAAMMSAGVRVGKLLLPPLPLLTLPNAAVAALAN
jgi:hypothetical protein